MAYAPITSQMDHAANVGAVAPVNNGYGAVPPPQSAMMVVPGQMYHSADGTQAYSVDEYGRGTYWQLPPAPRLPSAAARSWNNYYHRDAQPQPAMQAYAPWAAATQLPPPNAQHHHEIEQQMMLHHQLSKLLGSGQQYQAPHQPQHAPPRYAPYHASRPMTGDAAGPMAGQFPGSASHPTGTTWNGHHHHHYPRHHQRSQSQLPAAGSGGHLVSATGHRLDQRNYAPPPPHVHGSHNVYQSQTAYGVNATGGGAPVAYDSRQPHADTYGTGANMAAYASQHQSQRQPAAGWNAGVHQPSWQPFHHQAPVGHSAHHAGEGVDVGGRQAGTFAGREWDWQEQRRSRPTQHEADRMDPIWDYCPSAPLRELPSNHPQSRWSNAEAPSEKQHRAEGVAFEKPLQTVEQPLQTQQVAPEPAADKGPAPPSPGTLDRSGVPLSAFGAEIIWHACAALLEPELLLEAQTGSRSPSSISSLSSPALNTPITSPQSPMAKDADTPAQLMSHISLDHGRHLQGQDRRSKDRLRASAPSASSRGSSVESFGPGTPSSSPRCGVLNGGSAFSGRYRGYSASGTCRDEMSLRSPLHVSPSGHLPHRSGFARTKSQERSRAAVVSALSLVSRQWQWSNAKQDLPTLCEVSMQSRQEIKKQTNLGRRSLSHGGSLPLSPREGNPAFSLNGEVSPAFRRFAHQVLAQTLLSPTAFLLALLYALRIPLLAVDDSGNIDPEAIETFASPPSAAPFKMFTLGLMIANKHLDDNTFLNKTWNEVTGIPLLELNKMEQYYLIRCNYEVALPDQVWVSFLNRVKRREELKISSNGAIRSHNGVSYGANVSPDLARSHTSRRSSPPSDETSRRVMLALDEMLTPFGDIEPLDLNESPASSYSGECATTSPTSPFSQERDIDDGPRNIGPRAAVQRPTAALQHSHQHCQSAPAGGSRFWGALAEKRGAEEEEPKLPPPSVRPAYDAFARSLSDYATTASRASSAASSGTVGAHARLHDVPLAPSALLELLNSGRSLASAH